MSFQLSILKILAGQPGGQASLELIKKHLAIFYTSGPEWPARMKRIASREPNLDVFGQKLIERQQGYWMITPQGRKILEMLEVLDESEKPHLCGKTSPRQDQLALPVAPHPPSPREASRRKRFWTRLGATLDN
ncbi:hypothetical protein [Bradyrhizobium sp. CCGE-LA001]|uniref:hypothetical protein n=1 Tax=Bradyrhizobium sp. CCGE-LA001 TaxID=1223566 RepID=UPI0002AA9367|nr:hypothetical protein [Bradyrhizobium sp. CCGE-LA001]AMA59926.1 hypothetical protein BCCGELA001_29210 [Bradyrhizobium sp. CCGE-LA001]